MTKEGKAIYNLGLTTIIIIIVMLVIPIIFFVLLNSQTDSGFGLKEISYSIVFAITSTLFLLWVKKFMQNRPYLGLIIGLGSLVLIIYSLFVKYKGPYTTLFAIISSLVVLIYLGFFFMKFRNKAILTNVEGYNDEN